MWPKPAEPLLPEGAGQRAGARLSSPQQFQLQACQPLPFVPRCLCRGGLPRRFCRDPSAADLNMATCAGTSRLVAFPLSSFAMSKVLRRRWRTPGSRSKTRWPTSSPKSRSSAPGGGEKLEVTNHEPTDWINTTGAWPLLHSPLRVTDSTCERRKRVQNLSRGVTPD